MTPAAVADLAISGRTAVGPEHGRYGGRDLPGSDLNHRWTFTLFPGEGRTGACAESGTVLHGKVRFRLGKPDRGVGPARAAPAIAVG
jgi:hypothetical protein